jgi:uncharacterized protein YndB with AHSA1/START domain
MAFVRVQEIDVAAPPATVFGYVSDITRHPEWADQRMTVTHASGPARGPGATYTTHVVVDLPVGHTADDATVVVVEEVPDTRFVYEARDGSGRYRWTFDLSGAGDRTHVRHGVERLDAPFWFRAIQPVLWRLMGGKMVSNGLDNLKARVEAQP